MEGGKFDIPEIPDIPGLDDEDVSAGGGSGGGGPRRRGLGGSGRGGSGGGGGGRRSRWWLWLVAGLVLGVAGTLFLPSLVAPYLPAVLRPDRQEVRGLVLQKSVEDDRLLLTVESERGSMLATFREQVAELDLLVAEGDSITLGLGEYRPFVDDPSVQGVRRTPGSPARRPTPTDSAAGSGGDPTEADTASRGAPRSGTATGGLRSGTDTTSADGG